MIDFVEATRRAGEQDDARFILEDLAQPPACITIHHVSEHHVQVLDHQHQPLALAVGEIQQGGEATLAERPVVVNGSQVGKRGVEVRRILPFRGLDGQAGQALEPELAGSAHLVALLGEDDGEEASRQVGIAAHFRGNAQQQARLAAAARADDDLVLVRVARTRAQRLDQRLEFVRPYAERRYQLVVG